MIMEDSTSVMYSYYCYNLNVEEYLAMSMLKCDM